MGNMSSFKVAANGMIFDVSSFDDIPDDVRAYLEELHKQIEETGEAGRTSLPADKVPEAVNRYFERKIKERLTRAERDVSAITVAEFPTNILEKVMDEEIRELAVKHGYDTAAESIRKEMRRMKAYLRIAFRMIIQKDDDWRGLDVSQAGKLFQGVVIALMFCAGHSGDEELGEVLRLLTECERAEADGNE